MKKKLITVLGILTVILPSATMGAEPEKLSSLRESWKSAKTRLERPVKDKYLDALKKLRQQLTQQERFGDAVLVRDEIEALTQGAERKDAEGGPAQLSSLRGIYEKEIGRIAESTDKKYVDALKSLQRKYAQGGELEAALAIKKELATLAEASGRASGAETKERTKESRIPGDATVWQGHHYKVFKDDKVTFAEANRACRRLGGHLVYLESDEERSWVDGLSGRGTFWIGGSDKGKEGTFQWLNGMELAPLSKSKLAEENKRDRDYLIMKDGGGIGCRTEDGHEAGAAYGWVGGYICEWEE